MYVAESFIVVLITKYYWDAKIKDCGMCRSYSTHMKDGQKSWKKKKHCSERRGMERRYRQVKVELSPVLAMKVYRGSGFTAPLILNFITRWSWVLRFAPWSLHCQSNSARVLGHGDGMDVSEERWIVMYMQSNKIHKVISVSKFIHHIC